MNYFHVKLTQYQIDHALLPEECINLIMDHVREIHLRRWKLLIGQVNLTFEFEMVRSASRKVFVTIRDQLPAYLIPNRQYTNDAIDYADDCRRL